MKTTVVQDLDLVFFSPDNIQVFKGDMLICRINYNKKIIKLSAIKDDLPVLPMLQNERKAFREDWDLQCNFNQAIFKRIANRIANYHFN